jgi:predicted transcriptional regulator
MSRGLGKVELDVLQVLIIEEESPLTMRKLRALVPFKPESLSRAVRSLYRKNMVGLNAYSKPEEANTKVKQVFITDAGIDEYVRMSKC